MDKKIKNKKPGRIEEYFHYDSVSDIFYIGLTKAVEEEFIEIAPGVHVELDESRNIIGIEFINASKVLLPVTRRMSVHTEINAKQFKFRKVTA